MTSSSALAAEVDRLRSARVLCVGDVMLDRFVYGEVTRISPEAPIPICRVTDEASMLGGAGNVVRNLAALGARAEFISVIGDDEAGGEVGALLAVHEDIGPVLLTQPGRRTTIKTRYFSDGQQLLRADQETDAEIPEELEAEVLARAERALAGVGAVVLSDYGKGVLTPGVTAGLIAAARRLETPVVVDPKGTDYAGYRGATLLTPNRRELAEASRRAVGSDALIADAARHIVDACGVGGVLATRGAEGMSLIEADGSVHHLPAEAQEVFDVSGAGDTVAATVAAALAVGIALPDAARLANVAAGIVVAKSGTAVTTGDEIAEALRTRDLLTGEHKSVSLATALRRIEAWRRQGETIGFTNGCFDLVHPGHISLLGQARAACDRLVVGLNSDESTRRLKGEGRPVQSEAARAAVLGSLATVDLVVIFGDDTPIALIEAIRPDVLVKGADYSADQVVGGDFVTGYGGRLLLAQLAPGHSTTGTIARMAK